MLQDNIPFQWDMRLSKRAQSPQITLKRNGQVTLVWPINMPQKDVLQVLKKHSDWVLKHLKRVELKPAVEAPIVKPQSITMQAIGLKVDVHYKTKATPHIHYFASEDSLCLEGNIMDDNLVRRALCSWVKRQGELHLPSRLAKQAKAMGLEYASVSIRLQKTRWGSCSRDKRINLNAALLFLPDNLIKHVLIHELSHLKHLNHSKQFWEKVAIYDVDYKEHRKLLNQHSEDPPRWLIDEFTG